MAFDPTEPLLQLDWAECEDLEFKSARGGIPKSLWETYSAMANTQGGVIFLGVQNDGRIVGIPDAVRMKKDLWNTLNNRGKVSINLLSNDDIVELTHDDQQLLAIRIPRATRHQRPVFIGQNPLTGTYRRNYDGDYHCTEQEVSRMLADRSDDPVDRRILEHFTLDDLDRVSLQQYRQRFASLRPTHPWIEENDLGFLNRLGGWRRDRASGLQGLTIAGLLMFGREETLREAFPQYQVDYRERMSEDPTIRWTDRLTLDGTWAGNLFQFYRQVIRRLAADLKLPFQLDENLFRKGETIVHEAIREALVNALIHADYQGIGGVVVEKYPDRLEFSNPGTLLVSLEQLWQGNISECRNKTLQTMFTMVGLAEKAGSGIDKIRSGWASQHWRHPWVTEQVQPDRVMWTLPMISLIPEESLVRLRGLFGDLDRFNELEIQALVTADVEKRVDNNRMCQITGAHPADISRLLASLVSIKALIRKNRGRWSWYHLPARESILPASHSIHKKIDSEHNESDSVQNKDHSIHNHSEERWQHLLEIAAPARNQHRLAPKTMETLILRLCSECWITRQELGKLLNRNSDGLRARFLSPMVGHGLLRLRFPDKPNRVDQAYRAADVDSDDKAP